MKGSRNTSNSHKSRSERLKKKLNAKNIVVSNSNRVHHSDIISNAVGGAIGEHSNEDGSPVLDEYHNSSVPCCSVGRTVVSDIFPHLICHNDENDRNDHRGSPIPTVTDETGDNQKSKLSSSSSVLGKLIRDYLIEERSKYGRDSNPQRTTKKKKKKKKKKKSCNTNGIAKTEQEEQQNQQTDDIEMAENDNAEMMTPSVERTPCNGPIVSDETHPLDSNSTPTHQLQLNAFLDKLIADEVYKESKSENPAKTHQDRSLASFLSFLQSKYAQYTEKTNSIHVHNNNKNTQLKKKKNTTTAQRNESNLNTQNSQANELDLSVDILPTINLIEVHIAIQSIKCSYCRDDASRHFQILLSSSTGTSSNPSIDLGIADEHPEQNCISKPQGWVMDKTCYDLDNKKQHSTNLTIPITGHDSDFRSDNSMSYFTDSKDTDLESGVQLKHSDENPMLKHTTTGWRTIWKKLEDNDSSDHLLQLYATEHQKKEDNPESKISETVQMSPVYPLSMEILSSLIKDILIPSNIKEVIEFKIEGPKNGNAGQNTTKSSSSQQLINLLDEQKISVVLQKTNIILEELTSEIENLRESLQNISLTLDDAACPTTHKYSTMTATSLSTPSKFNTKASAALQKSDKDCINYILNFQDILFKITKIASNACIFPLADCKWLRDHVIENLWRIYEENLALLLDPVLEHQGKVIQLATRPGVVPLLYLDESHRRSFLHMQKKKLGYMNKMQEHLEELFDNCDKNENRSGYSRLFCSLVLSTYFNEFVEEKPYDLENLQRELDIENACKELLRKRLAILCETIQRRNVSDIFSLQTERCQNLRTNILEVVEQIDKHKIFTASEISKALEISWDAIVIEYEELSELDLASKKNDDSEQAAQSSFSELRRRQQTPEGKSEFTNVTIPKTLSTKDSSGPTYEEIQRLSQMSGIVVAKYRLLCQMDRYNLMKKNCQYLLDQKVLTNKRLSFIFTSIASSYNQNSLKSLKEKKSCETETKLAQLKIEHDDEKEAPSCFRGGKRRLCSIVVSLLFSWMHKRCKEWHADIIQNELLYSFNVDLLQEAKMPITSNTQNNTTSSKERKKKSTRKEKKRKLDKKKMTEMCDTEKLPSHQSELSPLRHQEVEKSQKFLAKETCINLIDENVSNIRIQQITESRTENDQNHSTQNVSTVTDKETMNYSSDLFDNNEEDSSFTEEKKNEYFTKNGLKDVTRPYKVEVGVEDICAFESAESFLIRRLDILEEINMCQEMNKKNPTIIRL